MTKRRIMLVEDEAITALDISTSLTELGYEVPAIASSGTEAISLAETFRPDLILMDVTLSDEMTGIEAAGLIRAGQQVPIVFLTAHQDRDTAKQALTAEPFGYLTKPCTRNSLKNTIDVALYKSAADTRVRDAEEKLRLGLEQLVTERTLAFERTNQELQEFCYAISHELRAPIARIQGLSDALLEECCTCPNDNSRFYAERIRHASLQQRTVVDAILLLSRISRSELKRQEVDLSALAAQISDDLLASNTHNTCSIDVAPGLTALADPEMMRVCLENLLSNALKFTGNRRGAGIEVGCEQQAGEIVYLVRDNGAGFDMKFADKLFVPFQRLHDQDEYPGTGIGLATVYRIVKRHGGSIRAAAEPGKGATFYFTLS